MLYVHDKKERVSIGRKQQKEMICINVRLKKKKKTFNSFVVPRKYDNYIILILFFVLFFFLFIFRLSLFHKCIYAMFAHRSLVCQGDGIK